MNNIDFEKDQTHSISKNEDLSKLSEQVLKLKDYKSTDYLLLTGDPAIIGAACSIVSDLTNGRFNLLKWDRQEKMYYPIEINLYEKGEIEEKS